MRFTLNRPAIETFKKTGQFAVESFFDSAKLAKINRLIDEKISSFEFKEKVMQEGHNLVIENEPLQKALNLFNLAALSYEFTTIKPIRLAYDQFLFGGISTFDEERKSAFLNTEIPFSERLSVSLPVMIVLIHLKTGDLLFLKPSEALPKVNLGDRYLFLVFTQGSSLYQPCKADPVESFLKKRGYVYGDKLKDSYHPLLLL
ncbi:MAG: hypothetical protein ACK4HV_07695, partial [Parachlamydiaceae bacterium]